MVDIERKVVATAEVEQPQGVNQDGDTDEGLEKIEELEEEGEAAAENASHILVSLNLFYFSFFFVRLGFLLSLIIDSQ